jgi:DNA-binding NarL/FixJ family response regulator
VTESTTEPAATPPRPVDTWPLFPAPHVSAVPTDSAVDAARLAVTMLDDLVAYRETIRERLEAAEPDVPLGVVEYLAATRRQVAVIADMIAGTELSPTATVRAQQAARWAERIAGLAAIACRESVGVETFGSAAEQVYAMARPDDDEFDTAVGMAADSGDASAGYVANLLGSQALDHAERERRYVLVRLVESGLNSAEIADVLGVSPERVRELAAEWEVVIVADSRALAEDGSVDTADIVNRSLDFLDALSADCRMVGPDDVARVDRDQAADWSRRLWDALKYVVYLRQSLDQHAQGRKPRPRPAPARVVDTHGGGA